MMKKYDVIIVGAGPGGIFSAYELITNNSDLKVAVFEEGHLLEKRKCPIDGDKVKKCISCKTCSIMSGFGGAGAFSDGKYNITNDFGGTLYEYIGKKRALDLSRARFFSACKIRGDQAFLAISVSWVKAAGSLMASSESILRLISMPAVFRPCMKLE